MAEAGTPIKTIRPRRIDWPSAFWGRAEGSWLENDLLCRDCEERGCRLSREDIDEDTVPADAACPACRGSGLLVPAREVPDDIEGMLAAEEAGGCWLDWIGHEGDGLLWPTTWAWRLDRRRFAIQRDVYGGGAMLAYMDCGSVVVGMFELDEGSGGRLETVFRLACGEKAKVPTFVIPRQSHSALCRPASRGGSGKDPRRSCYLNLDPEAYHSFVRQGRRRRSVGETSSGTTDAAEGRRHRRTRPAGDELLASCRTFA